MKLKFLLPAILAITLLQGCGGTKTSQGSIRLINASTDYATLDLYSTDTLLAEGVADIAGVRVIGTVQTNILVFHVAGTGQTSYDICGRLAEHGVLASGIDADHIRMVTHMDVDRDACARAIKAVQDVCGRGRRAGAAD